MEITLKICDRCANDGTFKRAAAEYFVGKGNKFQVCAECLALIKKEKLVYVMLEKDPSDWGSEAVWERLGE